MRTLRKEPGKPWEIVEVPNELEALQKAVGGHLERVTFASDICKGNPGALAFVMEAYERDMFTAEQCFQRMERAGITGDKLYMLWNDCCGRDIILALETMMCMPTPEIVRHINYEQGRGLPITKN